MSDRVTLHLAIRGLVQGVGYRHSMAAEAERLGLAGWVRNLRDGSVEAVVQGSPASVEALRRWAAQGPPAARVSGVETTLGHGTFEDFEVRPTP